MPSRVRAPVSPFGEAVTLSEFESLNVPDDYTNGPAEN